MLQGKRRGRGGRGGWRKRKVGRALGTCIWTQAEVLRYGAGQSSSGWRRNNRKIVVALPALKQTGKSVRLKAAFQELPFPIPFNHK